jgi:hypothetical protein
MIAIPGIAYMVHRILEAVCVSVQLLFAARMIESALIDCMSEDGLESVCPFLTVIDNAGGFLNLLSSLPSMSDLSFNRE